MGLERGCRHERADATSGLDGAGALELGVDPGDGVGVDPQVDGELPDGWKLVARRSRPVAMAARSPRSSWA